MNLQGFKTVEEKIKSIVNYVREQKKNSENLDESKVSSYNFSTPYRKDKEENNKNLKDVYEA